MSTQISPEPIAIIGIGCRLPGGADSPERALQLFAQAQDAVVDQPAGRWSAEAYRDEHGGPGRTPVGRAGFLNEDIFAFEPAFFGISPREAASLDPQQRLLLEVCWEAFEDAGIPGPSLAGSSTGVFVGGFTLDAMLARFSAANQDAIDNHTATSSSMTLLSNRLSYAFDLRGPSMTVDTACSSSLVALHLACEALRRGDCELALAGGVNVILLPYYQIVMSKGQFLAPDGRCKTFEASADGYGRGEGAGLVLLKPLSKAIADGDRIHALVRATGVNQDGATDGIPMPNPEAQQALIEATCRRAGLDPSSVGYVEAHGTGTRAGDQAETKALGATYGQGRAEPLPIGSVKASIGHLEAAAGVAGLIKAVLSVRERRVFPHRRLLQPNPEIPFDRLGLRVPQQLEAWPVEGPARAAINSFGYGGTNAHAIVEQPPAPPAATSARTGTGLVPICSRSPAGLAASAAALAPLHLDPGELAGALARRRALDPVRAALIVHGPDELHEALSALSEGRAHPAVRTPAEPVPGRIWVYTGMGPQWWGMGRQLYAQEPVFAQALREVDALFQERAGWSILDELLADEASSRMARNEIAQPANLLIQVGLTRLLLTWGPAPEAILGHSVGEVAAAWAAGCLSLPEAVTVSVHRSRLQQRAAGQGGMLALGLGRAAAEALIEGLPVVIAADNAFDMVTLAGPLPALEEVSSRADAQGAFARPVRVEVPYHSPAMDPLREEMLFALQDLRPKPPTLPLYSTLTGARVEGAVHDAAYWWGNTRQPVSLKQAVGAALDDGMRLFQELGPHPVLGPSIQSTMRARGLQGRTLHSLRRGQDERRELLAALGDTWLAGHPLRWETLAPEGRRLDLPRTLWQRGHHWAETASARALRLGPPEAHPLLQRRAEGPSPAWTTRLSGPALGWLTQHQVKESVVLPGAALVEACLAAAAELGEDRQVEELRFEQAVVLPAGSAVDLRVEAGPEGRIELHGRVGEGSWTRQARGRLAAGGRLRTPAPVDLAALRARLVEGGEAVDIEALYAELESRGLRYGPAFRGLRAAWRCGEELFAELEIDLDAQGWSVHPALLDSAFQAMVALARPEGQATVLPVGLRRARCLAPVGKTALLYGKLVQAQPGAWEGDLALLDAAGNVLAEVRGLRCEAVLRREEGRDWLHSSAWVEVEAGPAEEARVIRVEPGADDPIGLEACRMLLEELQRAREEGSRRTVVITRGGVAVTPGEPVNPAAAAAQGLVRVAMNEHPELGLSLLDLGPGMESSIASSEEEAALRSPSRLFARRMRRVEPNALPAPLLPRLVEAGSEPMALEIGRPGLLDSLVWRAVTRPTPGPGEVEIEVETASLNFKDLMKAMGMLGDAALENAYLGRGLGLEAAGRVARVGEGVVGLAEGDPVFAYCGGALRSHLRVDARFVTPLPVNLNFEAGASMFVFLTAWYALLHAGRLEEGETVLIHSAAGGVGLAAVQIAQLRGARIIATAGTSAKRQALRKLGVEHVLDSRTLDFADEIRALTGGRGVDVVLNSLAGPALRRSLELVASGGRFLELGKQDLAADRSLGLRPFNRSISFIAIDLDRMATERPAWFAPVAREVSAAFVDGRLRPLPTERADADGVESAFRSLASGELLGKAVINLRFGRVELAPARAAPIRGSWLVTGGLSGFGLRAARWLARQGVDELVLASRRGLVPDEEAPLLAEIQASGVAVRCLALDLRDSDAVAKAVADIPGLRGVLHGAMELADRPLAELGSSDLDRAMGAKALGAWSLHLATCERELDHFVMLGSIAAQVGNPGQAAYAAANSALDGIAWLRASQGLPATSLSMGALAEAGVVAREASTRAHLQSLGLSPMAPDALLDRLAAALPGSSPVFTLVDIDWERWARAVPGVGWRRLTELRREQSPSQSDGGLRALPPEQRAQAVQQAVQQAAAAVFRTTAEAIDPARSLRDQGLDSILAVELAVGLGESLDLKLSAMELLAGRTLSALATELADRLEPVPVVAPRTADELLELICVTRPYLSLSALRIEGEHVVASVVPDLLDQREIAPGEVGRHLAILGSLACARLWSQPGRHAWPVATSTLHLDEAPALPAGTALRAEARVLSLDPVAGRAEAEAQLFTPDGRRIGRLRVGFHVLPFQGFLSMFGERQQPTAEGGPSPYARPAARPEGTWAEGVFTRLLPVVEAADCAGHFAGLPALPVSILGRAVQEAVIDGMAAAGLDVERARVVMAELVTERFAWAGEQVELRARPADEQVDGAWVCEAQLVGAEETVARFVLTVEGVAARRNEVLSIAA